VGFLCTGRLCQQSRDLALKSVENTRRHAYVISPKIRLLGACYFFLYPAGHVGEDPVTFLVRVPLTQVIVLVDACARHA
jgi:hypothetical protein